MTRRRASTATLFSQQNEERRVQSHRFSGRLAYREGISERNPASKIDQHRRHSTSGRCWAAAERSRARRWHFLGAQVFVFLDKNKGDSLRVTHLADEKKVRSFTRATTCTLGGLTPEVVQKGSERRFRSLCGSGYGSHSPEVLHFGPVLNVQHESLGKYPWCSRSLTVDLLQTRAISVWQGPSTQGEYSESSTHVQAVLPTVGLAESACGYDCEQLLLALDHTVRSEELFRIPKFRTPTGLMVQVKNKTQNWAILWHWLFWYQSVWLGTTSFSWKWCGWLYEENSLDFCITTLGQETQGNRCS